ncbi:MAG: Rrf2 family transcriptional regulator [Planctomycetes bacterium]|nr:Rrf2 family transcriptional regulator [Planctomycetota bacterium]MBL7146955.1 Rrf2 family transcriptional regulator [Phycisphaerae bacterium]
MKVKKATAYALHALMYMVRHATQLPITTNTIAKGEGIPPEYLAKIFQRLSKAHIVNGIKGRKKGHIFARPPEEISLLEIINSIEGESLFDDCPIRHCQCAGTPQNCHIYAQWISATREINALFEETSLATVAWNHPEHRFHSLPESLGIKKKRPNRKKSEPKVSAL